VIAARLHPLVLVTDDDRDTRELYRACFDTSGCRTAEAETGSQAIAMAVEMAPDVLLMDYLLPDIDGVTIARRLKQDRRTARIAILMVTGHPNAELERYAAAAGIDRVFLKPCLPHTLIREVSRVLDRRPRPAARPGRRAPLSAAGALLDGGTAARVRDEYAALPGLSLTTEQARLVFDLDREMCAHILDALVVEGFLSRTAHGAFTRPRAT
jgi:CheY-like chemotaxis protein